MNTSNRSSGSLSLYSRLDIKVLLWFVFVTVISIIIRYNLFPFSSTIVQTLDQIIPRVQNSSFVSLDDVNAIDSNFAYVYLVSFFSLFTSHTVVAIKLLNTLFDVITALGVWAIVKNYTGKTVRPILAYSATLVLPSVLLTGGLWGQNESVVAAFLVWMLYALLKGRVISSIVFFSIALSIKWWAVFLLPVLLMWVLSHKIKDAYWLFIIPVFLAIFSLPTLMNGFTISEVARSYMYSFDALTPINGVIPNLHSLLSGNVSSNTNFQSLQGDSQISLFEIVQNLLFGIYITFFTLMVWFGWLKKFDWNWIQTIRISLFSSILFPFILPNMESRYFFLSSILALLYAFIMPKHFWYVLVIEIISIVIIASDILSVSPYIDTSLLMIALFTVLCAIGYETIVQFESYKTLQQKVASLSQKYLQSNR